jgi:uncharacterized protein YjeT (DUF2065 family)
VRGFGYLLGLLLLIEGLPKVFNPQFWLGYSERNLHGRLPNEAARTIQDFSKLSDDTVRGMALVEIFAGMLLVFMASALRYRSMMFRHGPGAWMMGNPGMMSNPWMMRGPWMGGPGPGMGMGMGMMKGGHMHPHSHEHSHSHSHAEEQSETPSESI